jgi:hypothetical protein
MKKASNLVFLLVAILALAGCGRARLPKLVADGQTEAARSILDRAVAAHGGAERWSEIEDIVVRYDGKWASIGPKLQRVLSDTKYRKSSTEVILPAQRIVGQLHTGPLGSKQVYRTPESIEVWYDGERAEEEKVLDAAALVADAYQMFLTGPFFFDAFASSLSRGEARRVNGELCDRIVGKIRPGFGRVEQDLAVLSIGRETGIVHRVRFTLNGTGSTRGAEVEVTFSGHREIDGILWPTEYVEKIRAPVKLAAHRWRLVSLETNSAADPRQPTGSLSGAPGPTGRSNRNQTTSMIVQTMK